MPKTAVELDSFNKEDLVARIVEIREVRNAFVAACSESSTPNDNTKPKTSFDEHARIINVIMHVLGPETVHWPT